MEPWAMIGSQLNAIGGMYQNSLGMLQRSAANMQMAANLLGSSFPAPPEPDRRARMTAAKIHAEAGEQIIDRIGLWRMIYDLPVVGCLAAPVLSRLADRLEATSDEVERWVDLAEAA